jgi:cytochrome b
MPAAKRDIEAIAAMVAHIAAAMMAPTAANKESIEAMLNGEE